MGDYRKHLKQIRGKLPPSVRMLTDKMCLHDAEYLGWSKISVPGAPGEMAILSVQTGQKRSCLIYVLDAEPIMMRPEVSAQFEPAHPLWLYDEIDVAANGAWTHEILFSDGMILTLRFSDFQVMNLHDEIKLKTNGRLGMLEHFVRPT